MKVRKRLRRPVGAAAAVAAGSSAVKDADAGATIASVNGTANEAEEPVRRKKRRSRGAEEAESPRPLRPRRAAQRRRASGGHAAGVAASDTGAAAAPAVESPALDAARVTVPAAAATAQRPPAAGHGLAAERWCLQGPVVLEPAANAQCEGAVVWLHGPGGSPEGWASSLSELWERADKRWKLVLLRAPRLRISGCGGQRLEAWADILSSDCVHVGSTDHENPDVAGHCAATAAAVHRCVGKLERDDGVPPERVVIGGFSQGAACALEAAMRYPRRLAGCVVLSGWLLPGARAALPASPSRGMPFLVYHGARDSKVGLDCAQFVKEALEGAGATVSFRAFEKLGHGVSPRELALMGRFLRQTLSSGRAAAHAGAGASADGDVAASGADGGSEATNAGSSV